MPHAVEHLHIHHAEPTVAASIDGRSIWLSIDAPRGEGDESFIAAFMSLDTLRKLGQDSAALVERIEGQTA